MGYWRGHSSLSTEVQHDLPKVEKFPLYASTERGTGGRVRWDTQTDSRGVRNEEGTSGEIRERSKEVLYPDTGGVLRRGRGKRILRHFLV